MVNGIPSRDVRLDSHVMYCMLEPMDNVGTKSNHSIPDAWFHFATAMSFAAVLNVER
jgi:hypothetical protein